MSPSESDLRAALQHGDDAGLHVNPDTIIAGVQAIRARRVRILTSTAVAVLVAGGAVGLAQLRSNGGGGSQAGGGNALDRHATNVTGLAAGGGKQVESAPQAQTAIPAATNTAAPSTRYDSTEQPCPDTAPHLLIPGGGGTGQFGANDPLFAKPVDALVVCSYGAPAEATSTSPTRLVLTGRMATQVVASMEAAHRTAASTPCEPGPSSTSELLAFIGVTSGGTALTPVTATVTDPACDVQVTNGTAVRYGWTPPAVLTAALRGLTPPKVPPRTVPNEPTGIVHGTAIHS